MISSPSSTLPVIFRSSTNALSFPNQPEARFLPSEYLTFFTSVAASLMLVKAVPQKPCSQPVKDLMVLICAVATGVVTRDDFAHDRSVQGGCGYVVLALIPVAIALAAWCAQRSSECLELPVRWPDEWLGYDHHGGSKGEPSFVSVSLTLLMAVLSYHAKDAREPSPACTTRRSCWSPQPPQWWHPWVGGCSLSRRHRLVHQEFRRQQR